jgi:6-phosphofructokinase 1
LRRIAILTSGGDAPGMNAAIRAAVRTIIDAGGDAVGVHYGFNGLIKGDMTRLSARDVGGILETGGTMLGSSRCAELKTEAGRKQAARVILQWDLDGLIVIGGNGSQMGSLALSEMRIPVVGIASTIDNDLGGADPSIGFDTALNITLEAIDRLRTTASSHHRVFVIETMGNKCGNLALMAGIAGGAEAILIPESDVSPEEVLSKVHLARERGKKHVLIVVSEWARHHADTILHHLGQDPELFYDPRLTTLGHVVRGGRPTAADRIIATRTGSAAAEALMSGRNGLLVGVIDNQVRLTPLDEVANMVKPLSEELLRLSKVCTL